MILLASGYLTLPYNDLCKSRVTISIIIKRFNKVLTLWSIEKGSRCVIYWWKWKPTQSLSMIRIEMNTYWFVYIWKTQDPCVCCFKMMRLLQAIYHITTNNTAHEIQYNTKHTYTHTHRSHIFGTCLKRIE